MTEVRVVNHINLQLKGGFIQAPIPSRAIGNREIRYRLLNLQQTEHNFSDASQKLPYAYMQNVSKTTNLTQNNSHCYHLGPPLINFMSFDLSMEKCHIPSKPCGESNYPFPNSTATPLKFGNR